jgi:asparagine synthase (glutamine-hydrolysing)
MQRKHTKYWTLPTPTGENVTDVTAVAAQLEEAVRLRLISDVPLGVFLSGGIDSSAIAAIAARIAPSQIHTFNIAFEEKEFNESVYARSLAKSIGSKHSEIVLKENAFFDELD